MYYDVGVIGGGPAGAWCACRLAAGGAKVALIDASHPREKPCGGGVTGRALALVGRSQPAGSVAVRRAAFAYGTERVDVSLGSPTAAVRLGVMSRREFDGDLVRGAGELGATLISRRAIELARDGNRWSVLTRAPDGSSEAVHAQRIVGADGPGSMVRKRLAAPFSREDLSLACGYFVHGITSDAIEILLEDTPAGYLWSFPRPDHLAVGICAQADVASVETLMPMAERWIAQNVRGGTLERYSWPIPSLRVETLERERPSGEGWLLAGDAAGLVDPITREGIFFALESGSAAAACLLEDSHAERRYAERLRDTVYRELTLAARIKARFYRPAFMRLLISALQRSSRIRGVMADLVAGEQPYATLRRRLLATMELTLMLELFGLRR